MDETETPLPQDAKTHSASASPRSNSPSQSAAGQEKLESGPNIEMPADINSREDSPHDASSAAESQPINESEMETNDNESIKNNENNENPKDFDDSHNINVEIDPPSDEQEDEESVVRELSQQIDEYEGMLKRQQAEFDNYRKRTLEERQNLIKYAPEGFVKKFLPILSYYNQALSQHQNQQDSSTDETDVNSSITDEVTKRMASFMEGFTLIKQQFDGVLAEFDVKPSTARGDLFDPRLHQAVLMEPAPEGDTDIAADTVSEILEQGYLLHDRVIKEAQVKVLQRSAPPPSPAATNEDLDHKKDNDAASAPAEEQ